MKIRALLVITAFLLLPVVVGCYMNNNAATASMHNSDNRLAGERARLDSNERIAQADSAARIHESTESTNRVIINQQGNLALLTAQSQHMITIRQMGTDRLYAFMGWLTVVMFVGGAVWLVIYLRNNPRPVVYQMLPETPQYNALPAARGSLPQKRETSKETALAVPYSTFVNDPRFAAYGWEVQDDETGIQVDGQGRIINKCKLLEG